MPASSSRRRNGGDDAPDAPCVRQGSILRWRMLANAPAATAGGSEVVKMKPEAKLRMKSQSVADAAM